MRALWNGLRQIADDVVTGKYLETYAVALLALIFAILVLLGNDLPLNLQNAVLLSAVALLVYKSIERRDEARVDLDQVLHDRQSFSPFREFIKGGRELWVYGPSAVNVLTNAADIEKEILERGGSLKVVLQDYTVRHSLDILRQQLDRLSTLLEQDIQRSLAVLNGMKGQNWRVDYRLLAFSPGFSLVIVDPDGRDGRLVVEFFGFNNDRISERMHIVIYRRQSQYWFEYWAKQFEQMWKIAREPNVTEAPLGDV